MCEGRKETWYDMLIKSYYYLTSLSVITEGVPLKYKILCKDDRNHLLYTTSLVSSPFYLYVKAKIAINVIYGFFFPILTMLNEFGIN